MLVLCQCFTSVSPAVRSATRLVGSQKKHRPLIEICPDVDNPNQNKQDSPAGECTHPPADALHIKDVSDDQGPHNLGDPVKETIKRTGPNVEDSTVVVIEF